MIHVAKFLKGYMFTNTNISHKSAIRAIQDLFEFGNDILNFRVIRSYTISNQTLTIVKIVSIVDIERYKNSKLHRKVQAIFQ